MNPLRWSGFLSFIVLTAIISILAVFFIEPFVKSSLEDYLSQKNNASVDIDKVVINYFPLSVEVFGLQISDSQNLNKNAMQIDTIKFQLSSRNLLLKKFIINEMSLDNVQINKNRKTKAERFEEVAAVEEAEDKNESSFSNTNIELPNIDDILEKEDLISNEIFSKLKQDMANTDEKWSKIKTDISDTERWNEYDQRYAEIKDKFKGNAKSKLAALKDVKKLKKDLVNEADKIKQAQQQFKEDTERLNDGFKQAKSAPSDDLSRLKKKYKIGNLDAQNITQILLGNQAAEYIALADKWYKKIKPYIESDDSDEDKVAEQERGHGKLIKFIEFEPLPDLLIRRIAVSADLPRGQFFGEIKNLSSDQSVNAQPMTFSLSAKNILGKESEEIQGEFNYVNPKKSFIWADYTVKSEVLNNVVLSKNKNLPINIKKSLMDIKIQNRFSDGRFTSKGLFNFTDVSFSSSTVEDVSSFSNMLLTSFQKVDKFEVETRVKGSWGKLKIKLESDLDNKIGVQLKSQMNKKTQEFESNLKARLTEKFKEPLASLEKKRKKLDKIKASVADKNRQIKNRLNEIKSSIENQKLDKKNNLNNKLKSKKDNLRRALKDKFKR